MTNDVSLEVAAGCVGCAGYVARRGNRDDAGCHLHGDVRSCGFLPGDYCLACGRPCLTARSVAALISRILGFDEFGIIYLLVPLILSELFRLILILLGSLALLLLRLGRIAYLNLRMHLLDFSEI